MSYTEVLRRLAINDLHLAGLSARDGGSVRRPDRKTLALVRVAALVGGVLS